jgi:SAM-dependent methyltransferase
MPLPDVCPLYADPELYDTLFPTAREGAAMADELRRQRTFASERFYIEEALRSGGPVLEVACGSGRLAIPLAQSGLAVCGIDLSAAMLNAARSRARTAGVSIDFLEADMRCFDLDRRFSTILIPGNSLLHLESSEDLLACLGTVRRHLATGGRLIFDVSKWDLALLARDPSLRYPVMRVMHPALGEIAIDESARYDSAAQVREIAWFLSTGSAPHFRTIEYRLRVIFPQELLLLLETAGFRLEARYGEFTRIPFDSASPRQVCVCSARA